MSIERRPSSEIFPRDSFDVPWRNRRSFDDRQKTLHRMLFVRRRTHYFHGTRCPLRNDSRYAIEFTPWHATRAPVCTHARACVRLRSNGNSSRQRSRSRALFLPRVTKAGAYCNLVGGKIARDLYEKISSRGAIPSGTTGFHSIPDSNRWYRVRKKIVVSTHK